MLLLERLERIHQQHVPRRFDVSHLSDEVLNAPRASNAGVRRKQQQQIERENEKLQTRLLQARSGTLSNKKLALDADKHRYLAEQISKVARRRKVRERCQALSEEQRQAVPAALVPVAARARLQLFNDESYIQFYDGSEYEEVSNRHGMPGLSGSKSLSRLDRNKKPGGFSTLPQIHQQDRQHHDHNALKIKTEVMASSPLAAAAACSPTLTHTTKLISALDLPRMLRNSHAS